MITDEERLKTIRSRRWRLNHLYYILSDKGERILFKMNLVQYALYLALWWLNIILKSRQHGITTFVCIFFLDACLFNSNVRAGIVCHKLEDAKRIFRDKTKYAYDNLPDDLKAGRTLLKQDACEMLFSNNSSIYVGVSMRSGTLQYLHVSEYDWVCAHDARKAREIKTGAMETVHEDGMIIIESTQEAIGTDFHLMCETAQKIRADGIELTRMDYKFHFFSWYKKPENVLNEDVLIDGRMAEYFRRIEAITGDVIDVPHRQWYVKKKSVLGRDIYKEHPSTPEEASQTAIEGSYYAHEMIAAKEDGRIGNYKWDKAAQVFTFWDIGSIHTAIWWWQFIRDEIRIIDFHYDNTGQGLAENIKMVLDKPYNYAEHWSGWDLNPDMGSNRKNPVSGKAIIDEAANLGIVFNVLAKSSFNDRIAATRMMINKCYFNEETTAVGIKAMFNYRQAINYAMSTEARIVYAKDAAPGPECHIADAFGHGAMTYTYHIYVDGVMVGQKQPRMPSGVNKGPWRRNVLMHGMGRRN